MKQNSFHGLKLLVVMAWLLLLDRYTASAIEIDLVRIFGVLVDHVAVTQHSAPAYVEAALVVVVLGRNSGCDFPGSWKVHAHISPPCSRWAARASSTINPTSAAELALAQAISACTSFSHSARSSSRLPSASWHWRLQRSPASTSVRIDDHRLAHLACSEPRSSITRRNCWWRREVRRLASCNSASKAIWYCLAAVRPVMRFHAVRIIPHPLARGGPRGLRFDRGTTGTGSPGRGRRKALPSRRMYCTEHAPESPLVPPRPARAAALRAAGRRPAWLGRPSPRTLRRYPCVLLGAPRPRSFPALSPAPPEQQALRSAQGRPAIVQSRQLGNEIGRAHV